MQKRNIQTKLVTTILFITILIIPAILSAQPALAVTPTPTKKSWDRELFKDLFPGLKGKAAQELDRKITKLNELIKTVDSLDKLSDTEKTALKTNLQNEITQLTKLKTELNGELDLLKLLQDQKSEFGSYSKYSFFLRKGRIVAGSNAVLASVTKFTEISTKLSQRIQDAKTNGKNVSNLETLLADLNAKNADAKTKAQLAKDTVTPLKPEDYPGNKPQLEAARASLKTAKNDIHDARSDAWKIYTALKNLTGTPTPTATPTSTPTPTVTPTPEV